MVPEKLWTKPFTDIGKFFLAAKVKIQIDASKSLLNHKKKTFKYEKLWIRHTILDYIKRSLIIPYTSVHNIPLLPVRKQNSGR